MSVAANHRFSDGPLPPKLCDGDSKLLSNTSGEIGVSSLPYFSSGSMTADPNGVASLLLVLLLLGRSLLVASVLVAVVGVLFAVLWESILESVSEVAKGLE